MHFWKSTLGDDGFKKRVLKSKYKRRAASSGVLSALCMADDGGDEGSVCLEKLGFALSFHSHTGLSCEGKAQCIMSEPAIMNKAQEDYLLYL